MHSRTPTFVISMKDASERRAIFADRAKDAGMEWHFFDAREDLEAGLVYDDAEARVIWGRPLNQGEIGCYSSHYALWQQLLAGEEDQYLILEDDVIADWAMLAKVAATNMAASGVQLLRLYQKAPCSFIIRNHCFLPRRSFLLELTSRPSGTQGYVITRAAARTLVGFCRRVTRPIDEQMDRYWNHGVPNFCLFPFPVIEESGDSTIGDHRFVRLETSLRRKIYVRLDRMRRIWATARRKRVRGEWHAVAYERDPGAFPEDAAPDALVESRREVSEL